MDPTRFSNPPVVVKVGGSLYDLPDLGLRLGDWLSGVTTSPVLLVPGGGKMADTVRELDRRHQLGEEAAHWLALRVMAVQALFLAALVTRAVVVETLEACGEAWTNGNRAVLDAHTFAQADEGNADALPHSWAVTSDSVAARAARLLKARRLVLLKSVDGQVKTDWEEAARAGLVDAWFPRVVGDLAVDLVNFRGGPL
jgi:5-(aminomethyl)-3-furanmethanol phosphate kinase